MADTLVNTLYPPVVATFQPAFVYTDSAVITFSLSPFNSPSDIKYIHLSVVDQRNNENVLKETASWDGSAGIFNGILVMKFPEFTNVEGISQQGDFVYDADNDLYSVLIKTKWLNQDSEDTVDVKIITVDETVTDENGNFGTKEITEKAHYFNVGQYYKVQLRFDATEEDIGDEQTRAQGGDEEAAEFIANYMTTQRPYFSEWSEVTLIKPIFPMSVVLSKFDMVNEGETLGFNRGLVRIAGAVSFNGDPKLNFEETEHLQTYRLLVTNINTQRLFFDSGEIYSQKNPDGKYGINYLLDMGEAVENSRYDLKLFLTTNNGYQATKSYQFDIAEFFNGDFKNCIWNNKDYVNHPTEQIKSAEDLEVNQEDGVITINFSCPSCEAPGNLYIKRACSKDGYKTWKVISITKHKGNDVATKIVDYTPCSLHSYKYSAQYEYKGGLWSHVYYSNVVYLKFYEMLLMRQNRQIAIRYNGQLTSWKPVVNRQKIDTLGGKYPKFVENATLNYKQYTISGIISAEGDFNRKFLNENDGEWVQREDDEYDFNYYYQRDLQSFNNNFDSSYMVRNDTAADGELGYLEKKVQDPAGNSRSANGNLYIRDLDNPYIWAETSQKIHNAIITDDEYSKSVFDDTDYALYHQHDLFPHNNWYWEREFRNQLVEWLNDGEPKLYRSMPEGNVAVILMDVNLTPTMSSRQLYNFSATLYEVGNGYDLDVLDSLGIVDIPKIEMAYVPGADSSENPDDEGEDSSYTVEKVGQMYYPQVWGREMISGTDLSERLDEWDLFNIAERLRAQQGGFLKNTEILTSTISLSNVKITFITKPRYYQRIGETWKLWEKKDPETEEELPATQEELDTLWLGYLLRINEKQVFVNERGYYQIPSDTPVTNILIEKYDQVVVDYIITYKQQYISSNIPKRSRLFKKIIGQQAGMFKANKAIGKDVYDKYYMIEYNLDKGWKDRLPNFTQYLQYWKGICIDVSPYAFIGVTYKDEKTYNTYLVGRHGVLHLLEDTPVEDITFLGRKMFEVDKSRKPYLDEWEYVVHEEEIDPDQRVEDTGWMKLFNQVNKKDNKEQFPLVGEENTAYIALDTGKSYRWDFDHMESTPEEQQVEEYWGYFENQRIEENIAYTGNTVYVNFRETLDEPSETYRPYEGWGSLDDLIPDDPTKPAYYKIKDPEYNHVYIVKGDAYIYYIDDKFYPITLLGDGTALAAVPVYGVVNYKGDIVRSEYS